MTKTKILMVDDEMELLETNKDYFEHEGFDVSTAQSGFEALELLSEQKYDAIITDFTMPKMDGIQFASYVKVNESNATTPIFVISGNINENAIERLKKIGIIGFIAKPYDIANVVNIVKAKTLKASRSDAYSDEIVTTFKNSTSEIFSHYFNDRFKIIDSKVSNSKAPPALYGSVIPIFGQYLYGCISVYCNSDVLLMVCKSLFGEKNTRFSDNFLCDLIGEINNSIAGSLKLNLAKKEEIIALGLPVSIKAHSQTLALIPSSPKHVLTILVDKSPCYLEFCLGDPVRIASIEREQRMRIFNKA